MNPQFLAMLPGELQATVQEAEQIAGCAIEVVPNSTANEFDSLRSGIDRGVCVATIAYRGETISRCALLHEVLHLKRYWLDAVPVLKSISRYRYEAEAPYVDELIEHLMIIPEEARFERAESNKHWSSVLADLAVSPRVGFPLSQAEVDNWQRSLLLQRAMMDIALPDLDHTRLYDRLRDENLLESSAAFIDGLRNTLNDKESALIFVSREFRYDVTAFCVGRFNVRAKPKRFDLFPLVR